MQKYARSAPLRSSGGFGATGLLAIILVVVAVAGASFYAYHAHHTKTATSKTSHSTTTQQGASSSQASSSTDAYAGWQIYTSADKTFSIKYPANWQMFHGDKPSIATSTVAFGPAGNSSAITISSFATAKTPKDWELANEQNPPVISQQDLTINGNPAYHQEIGDATYTDLSYAVAHNGLLVSIAMVEKATTPATDNSALASDFDLIAKSLTFAQ